MDEKTCPYCGKELNHGNCLDCRYGTSFLVPPPPTIEDILEESNNLSKQLMQINQRITILIEELISRHSQPASPAEEEGKKEPDGHSR